jgi:ABC-type polysaccharide/polyol phosphate export permease
VLVLTQSNLKARYRKAYAGFFWVIANPILMFGAQGVVFRRLLKIPVPDFELFLLSGLLPWLFISQTLEMSCPLWTARARTLKSVPVHPLTFLLSLVIDNLINFGIAFLVLLTALGLAGLASFTGLPLLVPSAIVLTAGVIGMAWMLATLQVFFYDTRFIVSFVLSVGFFLTPVFYPASEMPAEIRWLIRINPFHLLIDPFRHCVHSYDLEAWLQSMALALVVATVSLLSAALLWARKSNHVYLQL